MLYPELEDLLSYKNLVQKLKFKLAREAKLQNQGGELSILKGQGLEFDSVRPYVYGDEVRHIDWKVTARTGKSHIKTYQKESLRNISVVIDCNAYMRFGTRGTFKSVQAARLAAIICYNAVYNNDKISAFLFGDVAGGTQFIDSGNKAKVYEIMNKLCSRQEYNNKVDITKALSDFNKRKNGNDMVFIISDFLSIDEDFTKELYKLGKKSDVYLISVNDPSDYNIEDIGQLVFTNGDLEFAVNTSDKIAFEKYQQLWNNNRMLLTKAKAIAKAKYIAINTQDDPLRKVKYAS